MPSLKLLLLGPPRVEYDDALVEFDTRKNLALLAYLALEGRRGVGERHTREALITLLWPELEPSRARAGLRRNLSVLRKALGGEWLVVDRETVGLDLRADLWLDVDRFRGLLEGWRGHGHPEAEVCPECLTALTEAVELYRGDFLAGFTLRDSASFDEWQFFQTEGLRQELTGALERLVRGHSAREAYAQAIPYARRWLALDPLHEPVHRALMVLYAQAGQRAAALRQYRECERVLDEELGLSPDEETTRLYQAIRERQELLPLGVPVSAPAAVPRHNLPLQPFPFVGREAMLAEIADRLRDPACRLLTLVGPGGSGKTRLAMEAGAARLEDFEDSAFLVSLAPLRSADSIVPTVAQALGCSFHGAGDPRQQLLAYLGQKGMLLILDGFEHLLEEMQLVTDILKAALDLKILVTSRVGLKVQDEHLFPVTGMEFPDWETSEEPAVDIEGVARYSAVKLFLAGAHRVQPAFELAADNAMDVIRLCRLVDGMPLAILLAAAWVKMLTPAEIADEIERSLDFLETDLRDLPERQRSMRAVFDHSWNLLTEREREVLTALSIFRGGFTRQAAQRVTGASLRELKALVDRSLVHRAPAPSTPLRTGERYEMHELLRQYAAEKLEGAPEASEAAGDRHCAHYIGALEQWEADLKGPRQQAALAEMDVEIDNARAAWNWAADRAQVERLDRAIGGLCWFYAWRARCQEMEADCRAAARRLEQVASGAAPIVSADAPSTDRRSVAERLRVLARILRWQGASSHSLGRKEAGRQLVRQSFALLERPELAGQDTRRERASILLEMASHARDFDLEESRRLTDQSLTLYQAVGDPWWTAYALLHLGLCSLFLDAYNEARRRLERSLALFQTLGDQREIAWLRLHLGIVAMPRGQLEEAERMARKAIASHQEVGDPLFLANGLFALAETLHLSGMFTQAQSLLEESSAVFDDLGDPTMVNYSHWLLGLVDMHLGRWERGNTMAQMSLEVSRELGNPLGIALSFRLLCCLALAEGERGLDVGMPPYLARAIEVREAYTEARRLAQESVAILREMRRRSSLAMTLAVLATAERGLGDLSRGQDHLSEALRISAETGAFEPSLSTLPAIALLLADRGERERAVELYALASEHPYVANSRWFESVYGRHIAAVADTLPSDAVVAAEERGRARGLEATAVELLAELEASDTLSDADPLPE